MATIGIIAEYNPIHNGHLYQIETAKKLVNAEDVVVIMSGNYVQRGTPAITDKYTRAKHAVANGVSLVIELPVCFATSTAEIFASAAVAHLNKLGICDYLSFGCECDDIEKLTELAKILANEPEEYKNALKKYLSTGFNYPLARKYAIDDILQNNSLSAILDTPNNILAVEYLKAIIKTNSNIKPLPIKRKDSGYHSKSTDKQFASASAIRECILNGKPNDITVHIPQNTLNSYNFNKYICENDFSCLLAEKLYTENYFDKYYDVSSTLSNRIKNLRDNYLHFDDFSRSLLTKNETLTHINRALLHILLNIKEEYITSFKTNDFAFYIQPLAISKERIALLKLIKENSKIDIIERFGDYHKNQAGLQKTLLDINITADKLYNYIYKSKYLVNIYDDFTISFKEKII